MPAIDKGVPNDSRHLHIINLLRFYKEKLMAATFLERSQQLENTIRDTLDVLLADMMRAEKPPYTADFAFWGVRILKHNEATFRLLRNLINGVEFDPDNAEHQ